MALQVDEGGGEALRRIIEGMGVDVRTRHGVASRSTPTPTAAVAGLRARRRRRRRRVDVVVFATGVRPRDELAAPAGLATGARGGVRRRRGVPHRRPATSGRSARSPASRAAAWAWSRRATRWPRWSSTGCSAATRPSPAPTCRPSSSCSASTSRSFGDAFATTPGALELVYSDPVAGVYTKIVVTDDARTLLGGVLVGDASAYASLRPMVGAELGGDPALWLLPEGAAPSARRRELPDAAAVCSCNNVTAGAIRDAVDRAAAATTSAGGQGLHAGRHLAAARASRS